MIDKSKEQTGKVASGLSSHLGVIGHGCDVACGQVERRQDRLPFNFGAILVLGRDGARRPCPGSLSQGLPRGAVTICNGDHVDPERRVHLHLDHLVIKVIVGLKEGSMSLLDKSPLGM